jgi:ankyrin repeat protein
MRSAASRRPLLACIAALCLAAAPPADSPVADAAMRGDADAVRALLQRGEDVNAAQGDGMTALHWAAMRGDADVARMLIYAGARLEAVTRNGSYTPLHLAARAGRTPALAALLEGGARVDARTSSGGATPLHFAAAQGSTDAVAALLAHDAEVDARDAALGQTPLMWAAAYDRVDAVRLLVQHGAGVGLASAVEDIPARENADRALQRTRNARVTALRNAERPAQRAGEGEAREGGRGAREAADSAQARPPRTEAASAAQQGDSTAARAAAATDSTKQAAADSMRPAATPADSARRAAEPQSLSYGQLIGGKGGLTPLHFAAREGNLRTVQALLDAGADIDQVTGGDHSSPLLIATVNGHFDLALLLLERGADPNLASDAGAAPLYAAINVQWAPKALYPQPTAQKQQNATYLELAEALLKAGADVNARLTKHLWYMSYNFDLLDVNTAGATPFWRAAYATDVEMMRLLVAHGADTNVPTLKPAGRRGRSDDSPPEEDSVKVDPSGLPPIPPGGPGVWPLHAASGVGYGEGYAANAHRHVPDGWLPAVKYLIEEIGADVNARDHNGYNALHHAAARGDDELILYLVEKGADVTAVSRSGQTTADMANGPVQRVSPFPETVALLEKLGSKNNQKCRSC